MTISLGKPYKTPYSRDEWYCYKLVAAICRCDHSEGQEPLIKHGMPMAKTVSRRETASDAFDGTPDKFVRRCRKIFTIGHSVHEFERFAELLKMHRIEAVGDVRSMPYSRRRPQFNKEELRNALKRQGVQYVFLGEELGVMSDDPDCYGEGGRVLYKKLAKTESFCSGIQRVVSGSERMNIALMCAEKDPIDCHRAILVARELVEQGKDVDHILATGEIETHQALERRLLEDRGLSGKTLPGWREGPEELEELKDKAYSMQEGKIAYVDKERSLGARENQL